MVLIVGATGYIGRYLSIYLLEKGYSLLALGRSKKVLQFLSENGVHCQYFDINDEKCFDALPTENVEAVIYLSACLAEIETPVEKFFEVNVIGVQKMLEFCRIHNITNFILSSSHKVYNDINKPIISETDGVSFKGSHSPYIISKIAAENFVEYYRKDFGIKGKVLRFTGVHGYGEILGHLDTNGSYTKSTFEIFFEQILAGEKVEIWGDQSIIRDHIYIKDVLSAIEAAIKSPTIAGVYTIASGVGYSQYDEAKALNEVFGNNKSVIELHPEKPGLLRGYVYDISKAMKDLNWKPQYTNIVELYLDYQKEWETKKYHNYHYIIPEQAPKTL